MEAESWLRQQGIESPPDFEPRMRQLHALLVEANTRQNLTRITDYQEFLVKHVLDSLLGLLVVPELRSSRLQVLDLGCGGGFPGLPLAMACPQAEFTELDSTGKKIAAVKGFIEALELKNCRAVQARGNEYGHRFPRSYDLVLARAVSIGPKLIAETQKLLRKGGRLIAYKTPAAIEKERQATLEAAKQAHLRVRRSPVFELPDGAGERQFLLIG
jgi:16S rRNA (guanine527-N7)-methyltransferase